MLRELVLCLLLIKREVSVLIYLDMNNLFI